MRGQLEHRRPNSAHVASRVLPAAGAALVSVGPRPDDVDRQPTAEPAERRRPVTWRRAMSSGWSRRPSSDDDSRPAASPMDRGLRRTSEPARLCSHGCSHALRRARIRPDVCGQQHRPDLHPRTGNHTGARLLLELRIRRLGVRVPPSAPHKRRSRVCERIERSGSGSRCCQHAAKRA